MQYNFITSNQELADFCHQASQVEAIAVDTEFVRTRTLYPQLGLIQIYDGKQLVLVDPLAIDDFSSLTALLTNPNVVKVLHSCSEDLETFWHAFKVMPSPIFDSQFAASIVGMGPALGYAKLVEIMLEVTVDKGESRTDWLARPLRIEQCDYAAKDVLYLFQLYPELKARVIEQDKLSWVYSEIAHLSVKKQTLLPLDSVYLTIKNNWKLSSKAVMILKKLAAWRTSTARLCDMALNFVVREENLLSIAMLQPTSKNELRSIPGVNPHEVRIHGDALLSIVADCQNVSENAYPPKVKRLNDIENYKNTAASVKKLCLEIAEKHAIPPELVGSKKQINQLLKWCWFNQDETRDMGLQPDLLSNWRRALFVHELVKIEGLNLSSELLKEIS
ncbi:ribonuclease D [Paraglaciecola psychrophila]|uniref:Ribonuclease D n=1 Tax=Paraglaciecola psychrophila 170 TaxID=1129794 RepID=K6YU16_9ALTE|nr:ribonuclease D [Paraglaciecola psychrophila]AGH44852.1 ribonuclease D [Paraglaciecola psychrophila 170]GAC36214.1 ribonuclease D [Paraglaciecola psychrophila 170]